MLASKSTNFPLSSFLHCTLSKGFKESTHLFRRQERLVLVPQEGVPQLLPVDVHVQPDWNLPLRLRVSLLISNQIYALPGDFITKQAGESAALRVSAGFKYK
jgi:hypothetical protein